MATAEEMVLAEAPTLAADPVFARWADSGLVWLPERGMGFYPVREFPYDSDYFAKYQAYAQTDLGRALTAARHALVARHAGPDAVLCDVGIGCGSFIELCVERGRVVFGYDVNPRGIEWLRDNGRWLDPEQNGADVLTFWDALEHIPAAAGMVSAAREWVFVSVPIVPGKGPPPPYWRHLRRDEHCWYWTRAGLIDWMAAQGFRCAESNTMESEMGRQDIGSFAFQRSL